MTFSVFHSFLKVLHQCLHPVVITVNRVLIRQVIILVKSRKTSKNTIMYKRCKNLQKKIKHFKAKGLTPGLLRVKKEQLKPSSMLQALNR